MTTDRAVDAARPSGEGADHPLTLMTVHAHPDDETIGTGGTMAKAVRDGHRVVLVTCTRGELGEIVVPDMDTPDNHRRLGEIRAGELEAAMAELGVNEWDNLGYRDSDMMGRVGNRDPRSFWQANLDEAIGRLVWLVRRYRPDVMTVYNSYGGYGHPDHIRSHEVGVGAYERAGDPTCYPEQIAPEFGGTGPTVEEGGLEPWAPRKLYEQAIPASVRKQMGEQLAARGKSNPWALPDDATPEQQAELQAQLDKMLVPDESITTTVELGDLIEAKWRALHHHVSQMSPDFPFIAMGLDGWREFGAAETFILRDSRDVDVKLPETDLFAGL
jgi:N-acetyl-1-D-myo-inositol-2-amino-2-deoxy-alpha-D-glucopyranoside deacetylase